MEKKVLRKVNQVGSMMIEALAMLALVSLVTPTLYKKAAERTMELQDINSATQIRALIKAADSYASANFATLVEQLSADHDHSSTTISDEDLRAYLPEGYQLDTIKNFGKPEAAVKLGGTEGHETLTSYVVLPQEGTLNSIRAARIASMVGANGGIVEKDSEGNVLDGVGNIWKLDNSNFSAVFGSDKINTFQQYSVGAISEHAINVGNSNSLENPKYLQRTLDSGEEWRNTMETTLYMGGTVDQDGNGVEYNSIEGVNRLIIGATHWQEPGSLGHLKNGNGEVHDNGEALLISNRSDHNKGSAWIEDSLTALYDSFKVSGDKDNPVLTFTTPNSKKINEDDEDLVIDNSGAFLNVNTKIDNTLETTGKTSLASINNETGLIVQPTIAAEGENPATDSSTSIYTKTTTVYGEVTGETAPTRQTAEIAKKDEEDTDGKDIIFDVQGSAYVNTALEVGNDKTGDKNLYQKYPDQADAFANANIRLSEADRELNVVGDAFVSDTLETGFLVTHDFDTLDLHAGGQDYHDNIDTENVNMGKFNRWFNATGNGVYIEDLGSEVGNQKKRDPRMEISDNTTDLYGPKVAQRDEHDTITDYRKGARLQLGQNTAQLNAHDKVSVYSTDITNGNVDIQKGAIVATGQANTESIDELTNKVNMKAQNIGMDAREDITMNAKETIDMLGQETIDMHTQQMTVNGATSDSTTAFEIIPGEGALKERTASSITSDIDTFTIQKTSSTDTGTQNTSKFLKVVSGENGSKLENNDSYVDSVVGIDPEKLVIWSQTTPTDGDNNYILKVDATSGKPSKNYKSNEDQGTKNNEGASVYIRRGAIEVEPFSKDDITKYSADEGLGYIEASRFVVNSKGSDNNPLSPKKAYPSITGSTPYDRYMVNPAYTSVMHDIKLTTRGGARLSDILPDFITKGIYLVTNTYREGSTPDNLRSIDESGQFASPYLGYVPAPTCPEGYAKVITLTPASFQMAQAGTLTRDNRGRFYISEANSVERGNPLYNIINQNLLTPGNSISGAKLKEMNVLIAQDLPTQGMWYLGYDNGTDDRGPTYGSGDSAVQYAPTPLYFQQSTWLKAATPSYSENHSPCTQTDTSCHADRWLTIIGFLYPKGTYGALASALLNVGNEGTNIDDEASENANEFYWNLFPVGPDTIEAYATVYCYFDRTNIFSSFSGDDYKEFVKQYDLQPDDTGGLPSLSNERYYDRLEDPHLKYNDPL